MYQCLSNKCVSDYRFAEDRANFSISTDDPMVTGKGLQGEYDLANNCWGLTEAHLIRAVSKF
jgi:adenosine deaminase